MDNKKNTKFQIEVLEDKKAGMVVNITLHNDAIKPVQKALNDYSLTFNYNTWII